MHHTHIRHQSLPALGREKLLSTAMISANQRLSIYSVSCSGYHGHNLSWRSLFYTSKLLWLRGKRSDVTSTHCSVLICYITYL